MEPLLLELSLPLLKSAVDKILFGDFLDEFRENVAKELRPEALTLDKQIARIRQAYLDGRLTMVLGAGVSLVHGLPSWETLLQKLLISRFKGNPQESSEQALVLAKIFSRLFNLNPLIAARYLRAFYAGNDLSFEDAVRQALYENYDSSADSPLLSEIVQFCAAPGKSPNLDSIINYNFDNVLESRLDNLNIEVSYRSIYVPGEKPAPTELAIYHVHGFLPQSGDLAEKAGITLSEDVYHRQYTDIYNWSNLVQIAKFSEQVCIFIGLSLTDPNLRRLLDVAQTLRGSKEPTHFAIRRRYDRMTLESQLVALLDREKDLLDEKVRAGLDLKPVVENLGRVMEDFEAQDDTSFGISTIWVDSYDEIPGILRRIRQSRKPHKTRS